MKLRVGILVRDCDQSFLVSDFYRRSLSSSLYKIEALIVQSTHDSSSQGLFRKLIDYYKRRGIKLAFRRAVFGLIDIFESFIVKRFDKFKICFEENPLASFDVPILRVYPLISESGIVYKFESSDIIKIKSLNLDYIVFGGGGILQGEVLSAARFGIISFHHANNEINRGGPAGFWEVFNRQPLTGFVLQCLSSELDGGKVIFKGGVPTSFLYKVNQCRVYSKSVVFLHKTLEKLSRQSVDDLALPAVPYAYPLYTIPNNLQSFRYVAITLGWGFRRYLRKIIRKEYRFGVAYQYSDRWDTSVLWRSHVIKNPPYRFFADPFVVAYNGRNVIFVEDYDYRVRKGRISAIAVDGCQWVELGVVLEEDFHLSYPFVFQVDGEIYMIPDSHEAQDIRLYKCVEFPLKWVYHKTLISGIRSVDTSLFYFEKNWWMLANVDSSGIGDYGSELHVFASDSFDSCSWTRHPSNPVIFDPSCARNGGLILSDGQIYRVFQRIGFDAYGTGIGVSKIAKLDMTAYQEEVVCDIPPKFFKNISGAHHLSFAGGVLAVDFVKWQSVGS